MSCWMITGGAGFIGVNSAARLLREGHRVIIVDNLSRKGSEKNLHFLRSIGEFTFHQVDVRNFETIKEVLSSQKIDVVLHLAGQVAVTTSIAHPLEDFGINALGTLNVLEAIRQLGVNPVFINASTNKVYGGMESVRIVQGKKGYEFADYPSGIDEDFPLDFHSPYGCSKGAADQYVRDYRRIYGLKTFSLRQSCIYGYHQFGIEDQGWVAWFTIAMLLDHPITIYGDGNQVRDILFIDDLVDLYLLVAKNADRLTSSVYNVGGGPTNAISILNILDPIGRMLGKKASYSCSQWRPGDQKIYVSNIELLKTAVGWEPQFGIDRGLKKLVEWIRTHREEVTSGNI